MAVRAKDTALRADLSRVIAESLRQAKFTPLYQEYGLVFRPPLVGKPEQPRESASDTWKRLEEGDSLVVSMDPANLPYSSADPQQPGFDVEIAQALAKELGVELKLKWIDIHRETAIGQLIEQECDLAFGSAIDPQAMDDELALAGKVIYSRPYYGTGYLLVARQGAKRVTSLTDLQGEESRRLGTQAGTIADYSLRQRGYARRLYGTQLAVLSALRSGDIDYAYMWSNIGWLLHQSPEVQASVIADYAPEETWDIAIATRSSDQRLKVQVDRALDRVIKQGAVAAAMQRYHVPYFAPSASKDPSAIAPHSQRWPSNRGPEPQTSRRQLSQQTYDGLEKIRSRGTLIVGLDQNNLPFSSAHPEPTGLDYEIAQLLAERLGVSLEVYWAYSSHDSYPAKLANKRLCDVILGVMHDDRFAGEVAFSEPYYVASYVHAVPSQMGILPDAKSPIAAESGIAVKGLADREIRPFANLEAILAAVASGEVASGYVISSRASWLAEQKWPGKIQLISAQKSPDRFGICAAVRLSEPDLRTAVDAAFHELRQSGALQQVFDKWHVPLDQ